MVSVLDINNTTVTRSALKFVYVLFVVKLFSVPDQKSPRPEKRYVEWNCCYFFCEKFSSDLNNSTLFHVTMKQTIFILPFWASTKTAKGKQMFCEMVHVKNDLCFYCNRKLQSIQATKVNTKSLLLPFYCLFNKRTGF